MLVFWGVGFAVTIGDDAHAIEVGLGKGRGDLGGDGR